jgi:hypothetical protein
MTNLTEMTKKQLLALATEHEIVGRHDMSKDELIEALEEVVENDDLGDEPEGEFITAEQLAEIKRRKPSTKDRDESGRVVRSGRNLSGNVPYRHKFYALGDEYMELAETPKSYRDAVAAAPMQVQLILKTMRNEGIDADNAMRGKEIVEAALAGGYLTTKIAPANLFAYYRRILEALGVHEAEAGE